MLLNANLLNLLKEVIPFNFIQHFEKNDLVSFTSYEYFEEQFCKVVKKSLQREDPNLFFLSNYHHFIFISSFTPTKNKEILKIFLKIQIPLVQLLANTKLWGAYQVLLFYYILIAHLKCF